MNTNYEIELTDDEARDRDRYARRAYAGLPVANGDYVAQGHTNYCRDFGHAVWIVDGETREICPRCGERVEHDAATVERVRADLTPKAEGMARVTGSVAATHHEGDAVVTWVRPGASIPKYPTTADDAARTTKPQTAERLAVNLSIQIDLDPETWTANYGIAGDKLIREDVAVYVENMIREQLATSGVTVQGLSVTGRN